MPSPVFEGKSSSNKIVMLNIQTNRSMDAEKVKEVNDIAQILDSLCDITKSKNIVY